jgi:hypothetical protein
MLFRVFSVVRGKNGLAGENTEEVARETRETGENIEPPRHGDTKKSFNRGLRG